MSNHATKLTTLRSLVAQYIAMAGARPPPLVPGLDKSMFHLPDYSYPLAPTPTLLQSLSPPSMPPPPQESKVVQLLSSGLEGKSVLEVPGVGKQTASKFKSNLVVQSMFEGQILTAMDLYQTYSQDRTNFICKLKAIGLTQTNIDRIVTTFDKI